MWQKFKTAILLIVENIPAFLTIIFAMYLLWESHSVDYQATELLLWLIFIVGLLATSELIERLGLLRRIEKFTRETWDVNVPKISVYPSRIDAMQDIKIMLTNERKEISIIAGSLGGTFRLIPDLSTILSQASKKDIKIRILISHPHYMAQRAKLEGTSEIKQLQRTLERLEKLFKILEKPQISPKNIRLYLAVPTCSAIITHGQRKLFLNPYTLGNLAENTLSLMLDGVVYPDAYEKFIDAHLEEPWNHENLSVSLEQFIAEHNSDIARAIADFLVKKRSGKPQDKPLIVSINGCTAMGKTRLANEIASIIKNHDKISCSVLETDGWISFRRKDRIKNGLTGFDPESYDIDDLSNIIKLLSFRQEIPRRMYNHREGLPEKNGTFIPGDIIIIDGMMSTHQNFRNLIDVCLWINCSPDSQKERRIERDIIYRNYTPDEAKQNWEMHMKAWNKFESFYRPSDCILIPSNRMGMLLMDIEQFYKK